MADAPQPGDVDLAADDDPDKLATVDNPENITPYVDSHYFGQLGT